MAAQQEQHNLTFLERRFGRSDPDEIIAATSMGTNDDEMNAKMANVAPELASEYARYPLKRKAWINPEGKTAKGEPCFIQANGKASMKMDYVYGAGPKGFGYYHLLTRDSYVNLYHRLQKEAPVCCCTCSPSFRMVSQKEISDHDDVVRIIYNRSVGSIPDDEQAAADAIAIARGTAKAVYNITQNEQLVVNAIGTGVILANG